MYISYIVHLLLFALESMLVANNPLCTETALAIGMEDAQSVYAVLETLNRINRHISLLLTAK